MNELLSVSFSMYIKIAKKKDLQKLKKDLSFSAGCNLNDRMICNTKINAEYILQMSFMSRHNF